MAKLANVRESDDSEVQEIVKSIKVNTKQNENGAHEDQIQAKVMALIVNVDEPRVKGSCFVIARLTVEEPIPLFV